MSLDLLVVPALTFTMLLTVAWRFLSSITRSHHWPGWYPAAAIGLFILGIVVVGLILELVHELRDRRAHRELLVMQQRYPHCHVTPLTTGAWFLTDKATGREYQPEGDLGHTVKIGKTRDAGSVLESPWTKSQVSPGVRRERQN